MEELLGYIVVWTMLFRVKVCVEIIGGAEGELLSPWLCDSFCFL
jgi:hypothetical protein